ncbi:MAG: phosphotyrosine protein phosphatase [Candidatus Nanoarchaeia archaeon]|nr:phosphotyrosine protein phosphatase [Candidatus Nanoarchaeia archaeon]MDD5054540.1 phosphotyrosine protein phosphatase [Candidatus Nanoarchaeia archaeon]MDD5499882.1 phosphotyrosine protein phosphatase [Candidatus Nanoarchaeia archaeon]
MDKLNLLFICNQGENRSRTGASIYKHKHFTKFAGFYSFDKKKLLTEEMLKWSQIIFVMEKRHVEELYNAYPEYYFEKRVVNLDIPDVYCFGNAELKKILKKGVDESLKELEHLLL